jgi:hypothetical protein
MKINEIITEGLFDTLKTAGQAANKNIARSFNRGATRAKVMGRNVAQTYQQTRQDQKQRFAQSAAAQNLTTGQLRAKNIGTFAGDVAKTIAGASPGTSYFTKATPTIPHGEMVDTELGKFKKTAQGWATETNTPVTDPNTVSKLNGMYQQQNPQPVPQVDTSKIQPAPRAGAPTTAEQDKFQQQLQAALQNQQGQQ